MLPRMWGSVLSVNVSAQSPPCSRNASPLATCASCSCRRTISEGTVTGARSRTVRIAAACSAGQLGCWAAGLASAASRRARRSLGSGAATAAGRSGCRRSSSSVHGNRGATVTDQRERRAGGLRPTLPARIAARPVPVVRSDQPEPPQLVAGVDQRVVGVARARRHRRAPRSSHSCRRSRVKRGSARGNSGMVPHSWHKATWS